MIIQESRIRTKSGADAIARHVLHGPKNETIRIMTGSDWLLHDAMREARREKLTYGLRHIAFNPDEPMTDGQLAEFARRICLEFHADPEHMTLVIHQKDGSTHGHLLLPEGQEDHILDSRFSWIRLEKLARLEEIRLGHALVAGRHDRSIARTLSNEGKHQEADLIAALVPAQPADKPRAAYTSQAHRTAERQGLDLPKLKQLVASLWNRSDGLKSFRAALTEHGLTMRAGDRKETRPGAHIIETSDGTLIGSFTRLTKVCMAEFRKLLAKEQSAEHEKQSGIHWRQQESSLLVRKAIWGRASGSTAMNTQHLCQIWNSMPLRFDKNSTPALSGNHIVHSLLIPHAQPISMHDIILPSLLTESLNKLRGDSDKIRFVIKTLNMDHTTLPCLRFSP